MRVPHPSRIIARPVGDTGVAIYHSLLNQLQRLEFDTPVDRDMFVESIGASEVETGIDELDELLRTTDTEARIKLKADGISYGLDSKRLVKWFSLMTAEVCNLGCSYCIAGRNMDQAEGTGAILMPLATAIAGIDWYERLTATSDQEAYINFSGGEPLANRAVTLAASTYARKLFSGRPLSMSINTNATLVDEGIADTLSENGVIIATSLDGVPMASDAVRVTRAGLGASERVLRGWRLLIAAGCELTGFMATVNDKNFRKIDRSIVDFALSWGFTWVRISYDVMHLLHVPAQEAIDQIWDIYQYGKEQGVQVEGFWGTAYHNLTSLSDADSKPSFFCGAVAGETISLHPDGRFSACGFSSGDFGRLERTDGLDWSRHAALVSSYYPGNREFCHGCEIEGSCAGGCNIARELAGQTSNDEAIRHNCEIYREMTSRLLSEYFS